MTAEKSARLRRTLVLVALLAWATVACVRSFSRPGVPPQSWWDERGPVVPHDSFPTDCTLCHEGDDWHAIRADFRFDHLVETGVELRGAHALAECLRCHNDRGPVAVFAARGCAGCHEDVHRGTLGADCAGCHDEERWRPSERVALHDRTRFPLVGAHAATPCWRCHEGAEVGRFTPAPIECHQCHQDDLARASTPDHLAQGWVDACERCHVPTTWAGAGFRHAAFPLTGAHRSASCEDCHANGVWSGLASECFDCHSDDYQSANDPDHDALGFPTDCASCHDTSGWEGARFDHAGIVNDCVTCHLADYQATDDPDHEADGFPMECELCHSTSSWQGADFDHAGITADCVTCHLADYQATSDPDHEQLGFPTECEQCHATNAWTNVDFDHAGITQDCVVCHLADYQSTTDPDHEAAGFPTQCELCHGTNGWEGADFDHDSPIDSGAHAILDCTDCHTNPRSFQVFSCTHCHEHSQSEMDDEHDDVSGYVWESNACYACHPDGEK